MRSLAKFIVLLAVGIGIFAIYLYAVDPSTVISEIAKANIWLLLLAFPLDAAFMILFGVGWYVLVKTIEKRTSLKDCVSISLVSLFGDVMIPTGTVTGEAIRLLLAKRKLKIGINKALASILVHRIVNLMAFILYFIIGLISFWSVEASNVGLMVILILALIAAGGGLYCIRSFSKSKRFQGFIARASEKMLKTFKRWSDEADNMIEYSINEFSSAIDSMFSKPHIIALSFMIFVCQWAAAITVPYIVFLSLGYEVPYSLVAAAYPIYSLSLMIPVGIPAMLGIVEASMTATFIALGVPATMASSASILTRIIVVWFEVAVTGSVTALYSMNIFSEIFKRDRLRSPMHGKEPKAVPSPQGQIG
ncbi:MAG: lysylphosphatidylglycerol synthase transmembrane domain-containing protein [Candidatus Nezhaarchaeales archaeon]